MIRLFFAIEIPDEIKNQIISLRNSIYFDNKLKWEPKEKYHITLRFLGETSEMLIPKLNDIAEMIAGNFNNFYLTFSEFGFFKKKNIPTVLWLGIKENKILSELVHQLNGSLNSIGIESENQKFFPHLTIVRIKYFLDALKKFENKVGDFLSFKCHSFSLIKSDLTKHGSIYTSIKKFNFKEE